MPTADHLHFSTFTRTSISVPQIIKAACLLLSGFFYWLPVAAMGPQQTISSSAISFSYGGLSSLDGSQFALNIQRSESDWLFDSTLTENRLNRLYISFYETAHSWFRPGLKLGYITLAQTGNPATTGINLSGEMLGVTARFETQTRTLNPRLDIDYLYHQLQTNNISQDTRLNWFELTLKPGIFIKLNKLHLTLGAYYNEIDGDQTSFGTFTQTRHFTEEKTAGGFIDLALFVDATGFVSLQVENGGRNSLNLIFAREY